MSEEARTLSILYKRRGHFDSQRDSLLREFQQTDTHKELLAKVKEIVTSIVHENPEMLLRNKGQLAALVEGVISRSHGDAQKDIHELLDSEVKQLAFGSEQLRADVRSQIRRLKDSAE